MVINDKNYELKYSLRSMFVFEEICGKPFKIETMFDTYALCYSCIVSVKDNPELGFDEFIDFCNDNPQVIEEFNDYMDKELKRRELFSKKKVVEKEKS